MGNTKTLQVWDLFVSGLKSFGVQALWPQQCSNNSHGREAIQSADRKAEANVTVSQLMIIANDDVIVSGY